MSEFDASRVSVSCPLPFDLLLTYFAHILLVYDRGNPKQVVEPHQLVDVETYIGPKVKLPHPDEIPNLSLEVMNYHKPPVGTFHAKYLVVDRKIVLLNR